MDNVTIATGIIDLDNDLKAALNSSDLAVGYREFLLKKSNEIIILSEHLDGNIDFSNLLFELKKGGNRIILLIDSPSNSLFAYALKIGIYDILCDDEHPIECQSIIDIINHPKSISDYAKYAEIFNGIQNVTIIENNKPIRNTPYSDDKPEPTVKEKVVIKKVIEKVIEEKKSIEYISFEKKILNIWGNPEFGCEFAYYIAKSSNKNIILFDVDTQKISTSVYLDISPYSSFSNTSKSGIDILFDILNSDKVLTKETFTKVSERRQDLDNLYIVTGGSELNATLLSPSSDTVNKLKYIIQTAYKNFDIVLTLSNESIIDPFTVCLMEISDFTIAARYQNVDELNYFYNYIEYLKNNKNINLNSIKFLAYKYDSLSIDTGLIKNKELFDLENHYLGHISFNEKREKCRNRKALYAKDMDPKNCDEYNRIFKKLGIVPTKKGLANPIKSIKDIFNVRRYQSE